MYISKSYSNSMKARTNMGQDEGRNCQEYFLGILRKGSGRNDMRSSKNQLVNISFLVDLKWCFFVLFLRNCNDDGRATIMVNVSLG